MTEHECRFEGQWMSYPFCNMKKPDKGVPA